MYPSAHRQRGPPGLTRFVSAPGSLLSSIADSVISGASGGDSELDSAPMASEGMLGRYFSPSDSSCLTPESRCRETAPRSGVPHPLVRHSSSPAEFFSHLLPDHGISLVNASGSQVHTSTDGSNVVANRMLKAQWSFSRQDSASQVSESGIPNIDSITDGTSSSEAIRNVGQSCIYSNFQIRSWEDTNSIMFSGPPRKQNKDDDEDIITNISTFDSQFSLPNTSIKKSATEFLQEQEDSVPCRVRFKRGCATHPRSIAERERRKRISERLRKLQDLVPNMDKQTSTADMLDLVVQHIMKLQSQIQKLNKERETCTCTRKKEMI